MSEKVQPIGTRFWGDKILEGGRIIGKPFEIVWVATREEFIKQFGPGEMTDETREYLEAHPDLYFYRTELLKDLVGLLAQIC